MLKQIVVAAALLASAAPALADSWNSNKNVERAMSAALATYREAGIGGAVDESQNCYAGLDTSLRNKNAGRDVEYCIAYEFAASEIDRQMVAAMQFPPTESLELGIVMLRATAALEKAGVARQRSDFEAYLIPRYKKIKDELPAKM